MPFFSSRSCTQSLFLCLGLLFFNACGTGGETQEKTKPNTDPTAAVVESADSAAAPIDGTLADGDYYFTGLIDHKYAIALHIEIRGGAAGGHYYYTSQKRELELKGDAGNGQIEMDETVKEKVTGHFSGILYGSDSASGKWKSPKGKELVFVLYKTEKEKYAQGMGAETAGKTDPVRFKKFLSKFKKVNPSFEYSPMNTEEAVPENQFTEEEIKAFAMPEYNRETDYAYNYYYGITYEVDFGEGTESHGYIVVLFTEKYYPGAFGIHNESLVMMTFTKNGEFIDRAYLGCNCMDTNMGANDYYSTSETFQFTTTYALVTSEQVHGTLIIEEGDEDKAFEERKVSHRNIGFGENGKIMNTGY